jgi:tetratricopeptide (TPR) repeat protein
MNSLILRACLLSGLLFLASEGRPNNHSDSLILVLTKAIENRDVSVRRRLERIEKLKSHLRSLSGSPQEKYFDVYNSLYHEYKTFIYDSAFAYAQKLIETSYRLGDKSRIGYARVKLGFILVSSGMFKETFDSLAVAPVNFMADTTKVEYYYIMARAYYDLGTYNHDRYYQSAYASLADVYMDSARNLSAPDSYDYLYLSGLQNLKNDRLEEAMSDLNQVLRRFSLPPQKLAVNYHNLSYIYTSLGDTDKAIEFMVMAALADLQVATKETAAMYTLAKLLYEQGDVHNAYIFIEQAMDDAVYYGARQRKVEIGSLLPVIAAQRLNTSEAQRKLWFTYATVVTVLSILVFVFVIVIVRQLKKLKAAELRITEANNSLREINHTLREANAIKEEYIGYYFNINSEYLNKIEEFKQAIDHKLVNRKFDDIKFIVNNIDLKREREALYFSFDKVFLKLFPDFVTIFNSFFDEKDRIILKENQLLNTELRIFALIRMGINDTEKIAKILNYSVNTIYAYKTRVKSKSKLPNEAFETRIMEIKTA